MQVIRASYGIRGFVRLHDYALRFAHMIAKTAQERAKILTFWKNHGLQATQEAFGARRATLYAWQAQLRAGEGRLESLNPQPTTPHHPRRRTTEWPPAVLAEIKRLRQMHPNLGPDKVQIFLQPFCQVRHLRCPKARTVARLIKDVGGLRVFPRKVRHDGTIVRQTRGRTLRKPKGFVPEHPGHLVTLDTIERFVHGSRRYILTCTDGFSRFSFAWATTSHASQAAKEFFAIVCQVFPVPFTYVLTDNGSEFKKEFAAAVREAHLVHWKTYPRCPRMNGKTERFNRTVQEEFVDYHAGALLDPASFNRQLVDWLLWYNGERPHWALDLKSPVQFLVENSPQLSRMWWRDTAG